MENKDFSTMTLEELEREKIFFRRQLKHIQGTLKEIEQEEDKRFDKGEL